MSFSTGRWQTQDQRSIRSTKEIDNDVYILSGVTHFFREDIETEAQRNFLFLSHECVGRLNL